MVRSTAREQGPEGIALKVGVHQGACLAVRANDRLDFFGSTVNIAARLQAQAGPGEVVLLASALEHPEVRDLLQKLPSRAWSASLKGVRSAQALVSINVQPSSLDKPSEPS
jgi:class 3 adenylate cyclase